MGFEIDELAFRKQNQGRPLSHLIRELLQNSLDEDCGFCEVRVEEREGGGIRLVVADGVKRGIRRLEQIWTIFSSGKRDDPTKRGRLGRGLKELISVVDRATVATVGQTVEFRWDAERKAFDRSTAPNDISSGTRIECEIPQGKAKVKEIERYLCTFIPPEKVALSVNGKPVVRPKIHRTIRATLKTVVYDEGGVQKESERATDVVLWEPRPGEKPWIFEMGIPVEPLTQEDNFRWHLDVSQRVPLRAERDRIGRAYMRSLYAQVLNEMVDELAQEEATCHFVDEALQSAKFDREEAGKALVEKRFGKMVVRGTGNLDDNIAAERAGYKVIHTQSLSEGMREVMRAHVPSTTDVAHPDCGSIEEWLGQKPEALIPRDQWTPGERDFAAFGMRMAGLLGLHIGEILISSEEVPHKIAHFTKRGARVVVCREGTKCMQGTGAFFERRRMHDWVDLLIHEFGHREGEGHDTVWHDELTRLGGAMLYAAPALLKEFPRS